MKCRLIEPIGFRYEVGFFESGNGVITRIDITKEEYDLPRWDYLKNKFPQYSQYDIFTREARVWNTEDGNNNHPGDMFWADWMHYQDGKCPYWDNCNNPKGHLVVVCPNGVAFDTDMRATNCNKLQDRLHRCWEKKGEPPLVTIGGPLSDNGVGSIQCGNWHGYLRDGNLVE